MRCFDFAQHDYAARRHLLALSLLDFIAEAMDNVAPGIVVPVVSFLYGIPLFRRSQIVDGGQTATTLERFVFNTCDGIGNGDARQTDATLERIIFNTRDGIGNGNARQTATTLERTVSNTRDGIGNGDARQTATTVKRNLSNTRDGIGYGDAR